MGFWGGEITHATKSASIHVYASSGKFPVNLTVTDDEGVQCIKNLEVDVREPLPEAILTCSPDEPNAGEVVTFDGSKSKDKKWRQITGYEWDFGDGYSGKGAFIDHQYLKSGAYSVKLTVTNEIGVRNSSTIVLAISPKTEPSEVTSTHLTENEANSSLDAPAWDEMGYNLTLQGKYIEAIKAYDKAIELNPQYAWAWNNKGWALMEQHKNYNEALKCFDMAIRLDPNLAEPWNNKGWALMEQNNYDEALKCFDIAIRLDPQYAWAWNNKGRILYEQKKYDDALECIEKAIELDPQNADAWENKGLVLKGVGRTTEADDAFANAKELGYAD